VGKLKTKFKVGDSVTTNFYPKNSWLAREVIAVKPYKGCSESGVEVTTKDKIGRILSCDSNWYKLKVK
jgi:hypothetical protein